MYHTTIDETNYIVHLSSNFLYMEHKAEFEFSC